MLSEKDLVAVAEEESRVEDMVAEVEEDMPAFHMTVLTPIERRKLDKNGELPKDEALIPLINFFKIFLF